MPPVSHTVNNNNNKFSSRKSNPQVLLNNKTNVGVHKSSISQVHGVNTSLYRTNKENVRTLSTSSEEEFEVTILNDGQLQLSFDLASGVTSRWLVTMITNERGDEIMLIDIDRQDWQCGSKEGFVRLLECAEECFDCAGVVAVVSKARADLSAVMHTLMFIGFVTAVPELTPCNVAADTHAVLAYEIE